MIALVAGGRVIRKAPVTPEADARPDGFLRVVHPYSVVPGGVRSAGELSAAAARDSVVAAHYRGIGPGMANGELPRDLKAYVSYRVGDQVYWTRRQVRLRKGEPVLTNGVERVRQRCGNRISELPREPVRSQDPPESTWDEVESTVENGLRHMPLANAPLPVPQLPVKPGLPSGGVTFANLGVSPGIPQGGPVWPALAYGGLAFAPAAPAAPAVSAGDLAPRPETGALPVQPIELPPGLIPPPETRDVSLPPWIAPPVTAAPPLEMIPPALAFPSPLPGSVAGLPAGAKTPPSSGPTPPVSTPPVVEIVSGKVTNPTSTTDNNPPAGPPFQPDGNPGPFREIGESASVPEPAGLLMTAAGLLWILRLSRKRGAPLARLPGRILSPAPDPPPRN